MDSFNTWFKLILCCVAACMAIQTEANDKQNTLTILTEQYPPYNFLRGGRITGMNIEAVRFMCKEAKITCKFGLVPWKRAYRRALNNKNYGVVSTSRTDEREHLFKWLGPLASSKGCLFKLKDRSDIIIESEQDLLKYNIGLAKNIPYLSYFKELGFKEDENLFMYNSIFGDARAFRKGRMDMIVASVNTLPYFAFPEGLDIEDLQPVYPLNESGLKGNYLALNPDTDTDIVQALNEAREILVSSGTLNKIIENFQPQPFTDKLRASIPEHLQKACL